MIYQVSEPMYSATWEAKKKKVVHQGGTSSGKTYVILQVLARRAATQPGITITVVGQDVPNLKKGAIRDMGKIFASSPYLQAQVPNYKLNKGYNKTDRIYEFTNGSIIEFNSYDSEQDAKSGKRQYLFVNEANGIPFEIYWQLSIRTDIQEFIDYNPTARFWVHEKLIGRDDVQLIISNHWHNSFLTTERHAEIESIDDFELWRVYARGATGQIHGLIYTKYKLIDIMPAVYPSVLGLDFGWNHKMALIDIARDANNLFWDELIYQTEMTIGDLIKEMKELNLGKKKIYADPARADMIEDLRRAGFNVEKADKDIKNGIDFVKRNNLYVTKRSKGVISELGSYKWKEKDGRTLDEPVKFKDDGMDAGRYGSYTGFRKPKGWKVAEEDPEDGDLLGRLDAAA